MEREYNEWTPRVAISLMLSMAVFIAWVVLPMPWNEVSYLVDPTLDQPVRQYFWWGTGLVVLLYLMRTTTSNIGGTIACAIFGPISVLTMVFVWISTKIKPMKVRSNG